MPDRIRLNKKRKRWVVYRKGIALASSATLSVLKRRFPEAKEE